MRDHPKQAENVLEGEARATSGAEAERMRRSPWSEQRAEAGGEVISGARG